MEHPFINDLSKKSLEELQNTITDLMGKVNFAQRMGNQPMINQLHMIMESYRVEYGKRIAELNKKQNIEGQIKISKDNK